MTIAPSILQYLMNGANGPTGRGPLALAGRGAQPPTLRDMMANPSMPAGDGQPPGQPSVGRLSPRKGPALGAAMPTLNDPPMFGFQSPQSPFETMRPGPMSEPPQLSLENIAPRKPRFFDKGGAAGPILGIMGDAMAGYAGLPASYAPFMQQQMQGEQEENRFQRRLQAEIEAKRRERMDPRIEQVGNTVGWLDPSQGAFNPFFTAPGAPEQYALGRGFQPGSPEYQDAVQEYRLGSWSDPAMEARTTLEGVRYDNRDRLQDQRLEVTRRGQDLNHDDRRRGQTLNDTRGRRGQDMTDARVRGSASYRGKPGKAAGGAEPFAVGPGGHKIVVRNGKWVDAATGKPVQ